MRRKELQELSRVEEQVIIGTELQAHMKNFDSYDDLAAYCEGKPILNKIGLVIKTRNGIIKASMILDAKQSGAKLIIAKAQRATLPRMFDAILQVLFSHVHRIQLRLR